MGDGMMLRRPPRSHRSAPAAERTRLRRREEQRRYRQREREGKKVSRAPFDYEVIAYMIATGWLQAARADEPDAIGEAYYEMIKESARRADTRPY